MILVDNLDKAKAGAGLMGGFVFDHVTILDVSMPNLAGNTKAFADQR